jgi:hypothetical protein
VRDLFRLADLFVLPTTEGDSDSSSPKRKPAVDRYLDGTCRRSTKPCNSDEQVLPLALPLDAIVPARDLSGRLAG